MTIQPQIQAALIKVNGFITRYPTLCQYEMLKAIEKKTKYDMAYFFLLFCSLIGFCLYFVGGGKLITDLVSFIYPAYQSFKAIDSVDPTDDTQWLTYWVVFAFVSIIENVFTIIADVIPFYFVMKVGFFVWLYHPKFLGAGLVYSQGIKPFILPYLNTSMEKKSVEKKTVQKKTE
mmetsp:Transcript_35799/g.42755  ORF Transcript_35799/g.42755 Transcript_35799/m.42755 type:complete len:175 (-) Transcript_35799:73-597(-)|eukprot:CAMPEP_0198278580 /NCGR_PEP_ID=MMETSP1447-20131203/66449_1 /TAXON_ID=420782 /ORGANISM="Chaetoceros dichaeta, Strain CCMP1751" /LENGTH=174 /DNA_ID=CAMNT_0043973669 /DNA_START=507 /DNA_END=1031 /DNA_ORIENTATION=+